MDGTWLNLSLKKRDLLTKNRRLRNKLLQLSIQINSLSSIAERVGANQKDDESSIHFIRCNSTILPGGAVYSAAINPTCSLMAMGSLNGSVTITDLNLRKKVVLTGHAFSCRDVYWGQSGLISGGFDKAVRIWDIERSCSEEVDTGGLVHSVCGSAKDTNLIFATSNDQVFWIDRRRPAPISINAGTQATGIACFKDYLVFGGYDGSVKLVDRRFLHSKPLSQVEIGDVISSLSRVAEDGHCVVVPSQASAKLLNIEKGLEISNLDVTPPGRFGCRADIMDLKSGQYSIVCGGITASFATVDTNGQSSTTTLTDAGMQYGAIFMHDRDDKVLSYSEDGILYVWSLV